MNSNGDPKTVYTGRHISMVATGNWEFVTRNTSQPAVGIVAITDEEEIVLVEQYRPPIGRNVVELPAGLAGDIPGAENEALVEAAQRELLEETGYAARHWQQLATGYSSPGLTDEAIVLFLARGLEKRTAGGGDHSEDITIHEIAVSEVAHWLNQTGATADLKLFAGLYAAEQHLRREQGG